eukprot:2789766-Rhodomonas_salina.2
MEALASRARGAADLGIRYVSTGLRAGREHHTLGQCRTSRSIWQALCTSGVPSTRGHDRRCWAWDKRTAYVSTGHRGITQDRTSRSKCAGAPQIQYPNCYPPENCKP